MASQSQSCTHSLAHGSKKKPLKSYKIPLTISEIEAMKKNNSYGLLRLIEDSGWMGIEYLKAEDGDGTHKIYLIRSFYNAHKPHQKIDENGQLKLI
jgi:hypothetical protein